MAPLFVFLPRRKIVSGCGPADRSSYFQVVQRAECHCLSRHVLAVLKLFTPGITICMSRTSRLHVHVKNAVILTKAARRLVRRGRLELNNL